MVLSPAATSSASRVTRISAASSAATSSIGTGSPWRSVPAVSQRMWRIGG